jgi:hypothetical protein
VPAARSSLRIMVNNGLDEGHVLDIFIGRTPYIYRQWSFSTAHDCDHLTEALPPRYIRIVQAYEVCSHREMYSPKPQAVTGCLLVVLRL